MADMNLPLPEYDAGLEYFRFSNRPIPTQPVTYNIEGDWSSAAFLFVAGAIAGEISVTGLDVFSEQGDKTIMQAIMETEGVTMDLVSFENLPVYNGDLDKPAAAERPDEVVKFRELLAKADGFVIATPEYNYSIPGGLKNAIDWASRGQDSPLLNKAVALMGATPGLWGTVRAQNAFHPIFQALNWTNVRKPEVFVANAGDKFNSEGVLTDEATRKIVAQQLQALKEIITVACRPARG
ncbi:flavin reductase [Ostertagia ostertagi]